MVIEKPYAEDFAEINEIAKDVHDQHVAYRPDIYRMVEHPISQNFFTELLGMDEIFIAKENDIITGYVITRYKEANNPICFARKKIIVEALAIKKEFRNQGLGTQLMDFVTKLAVQRGCSDIELTVNPENTGTIVFYEKLGMKVKNIKYMMTVNRQ